MARKRIRISKAMLFVWFMLAGLIFLFSPAKVTNKFQSAFAHVFSFPLSISRGFYLSASRSAPYGQQISGDIVSRREYNQLQNHLANVIEQRDKAYQKIERLARIRQRAALEGAVIVIADIITSSVAGAANGLVINRGTDDGLRTGQFVLGYNNIIGRIEYADSRTAKVELLTDSTSQIAVKIPPLTIDCIMRGLGDNSAKIGMIKVAHKVQVGDKVFARTYPGLLDTAIIIGNVSICERDQSNPLLWDITVEPTCAIEELSDVAVIIMNPE